MKAEKLKQLLINEILLLKEKYKNQYFAMGFSGGLDSCVLAKILKNLKIKTKYYTVGLKNSYDIKNAQKNSKELKIKINKIIITEKQIENALEPQFKILQEKKERINPQEISINLPLYFLSKNISEKIIILGQGPDELLGGYKKYIKLKEKQFKQQSKQDIKKVLEYYLPNFKKTSNHFKKTIENPFLSKEIIEFCSNLDYKEKIKNNIGKIILRNLAKDLGLSKEIYTQKKTATQYGTGIINIMKKLTKTDKFWKNYFLAYQTKDFYTSKL